MKCVNHFIKTTYLVENETKRENKGVPCFCFKKSGGARHMLVLFIESTSQLAQGDLANLSINMENMWENER